MARITHTDRTFDGSIGGVTFQKGVADTDDHSVISYAVLAGFKVDHDEPAEQDGQEPGELKGRALDEALDAAGLPKTGSADEKLARLADHETLQAQIADVRAKDADELKAYAAEFGVDLGDLADSDDQAALADRIVEHFTRPQD